MGTFAAGFPLLNTASCQVSKKKHESLQVSADAHLHDLHVVETIHACIASGFFFVEKRGFSACVSSCETNAEPGTEIKIVSSQKASLLPVQFLGLRSVGRSTNLS